MLQWNLSSEKLCHAGRHQGVCDAMCKEYHFAGKQSCIFKGNTELAPAHSFCRGMRISIWFSTKINK